MDVGSSVDLAFDGADDLLGAWREGLTPDPALTVSAWADRHRILNPRGSSEAGPWRTRRTP
jgi:phage terminase large subunit GpA-like protein